MARVFVARPGLQTTVQDLGRWGYQAEGVPVAGAMDASAHRRANALVGNPLSAATLEVTLVGPELRFDDERRVGVCGAGFDLRHDGEAVASEGTVQVRAGSTLQFGARISGARAYIAVSGGFDVPVVLGSRSTHIPSAMGGLEGRALRAGDFLPIGPAPRIDGPPRHVANVRVRAGGSPGRLRVLSGQDLESFEDGALAEFESTTYVVGNHSNRMGYRLQGHPLRLRGRATRLSRATPFGTVQVLPTGLPVLLMADRPTTGGYPAIAHVISADLDIAAQLAPGDAVRFAPITMDQAREALFAREDALHRLEARQ